MGLTRHSTIAGEGRIMRFSAVLPVLLLAMTMTICYFRPHIWAWLISESIHYAVVAELVDAQR